ncbi:MAG: hypothetical protein JWO31_537 [Phycisphaerales bacterium]|nr:hypothetical protein [Phycisphaerales bacterium]
MATQASTKSHGNSHGKGATGPDDETRHQGAIKDPKDWTTGGEPMTGAQESYLDTLSREAGEEVPADLTKGEASQKIDELRHKTGRDATPAAAKTLDR